MSGPVTSGFYVASMIQLRRIPAFASLSPAALRVLAAGAEEVVISRGTPVLAQGHAADALFLIQDGRVSVQGPGDRRGILGPGRVAGFLELLSQQPVEERLTAEADVLALRLELEDLRDACEVHFEILAALLAHVAGLAVTDPVALRLAVGAGAEVRSPGGDEVLDRVGRLLLLHRSPVFPSAGMDALAELAGHLEEREVPEGAPLWPPSEVGTGAFLITSGSVEFTAPEWDDPLVLGPGTVPGLVTTLAVEEIRSRAWARNPVRALFVSGETLLDVLEDHADMAFAFLGRLAACVREGAGRAMEQQGGPDAGGIRRE